MTSAVSVGEILAAVRGRHALLTSESAGYLTLAAADYLTRRPRRIGPTSLLLSSEGTVSVTETPATDGGTCERSLRGLLGKLLAFVSNPTPALVGVSKGPLQGDLGALIDELEAALIPVNRGAASRALARLARDTLRVQSQLAALMAASPKSSAPKAARPVAPQVAPAAAPMEMELPEGDARPAAQQLAEARAVFEPEDAFGDATEVAPPVFELEAESPAEQAASAEPATAPTPLESAPPHTGLTQEPAAVEELLASFEPSQDEGMGNLTDLSAELKRSVGLEPTPAPVGAPGDGGDTDPHHLMAESSDHASAAEEGDGALGPLGLPAVAELPEPPGHDVVPRTPRPKASPVLGMVIMAGLLVAALGGVALLWTRFPQFWTGHI